MNAANFESYLPYSAEEIELSTNDVTALTMPAQNISAATVAVRGGSVLYSLIAAEEPTAQYGRPINDGEEVVLPSLTWINAFQMIRTGSDTVYVYVTYYQ